MVGALRMIVVISTALLLGYWAWEYQRARGDDRVWVAILAGGTVAGLIGLWAVVLQ